MDIIHVRFCQTLGVVFLIRTDLFEETIVSLHAYGENDICKHVLTTSIDKLD